MGVSRLTATSGIIRLNGAGIPTSRTYDWRYWRLYCTEKPHLNTVGLNSRSTSTSPELGSVVIVGVRTRDGTAQPKAPVRARGFNSSSRSGRSPNPLPKNKDGVTVSKDSAPTFLLPVPPTSQLTPSDTSVSCSGFLKTWYFSDSSRLSNPLTDLPGSGSSSLRAPLSEKPRSGLRRFENSPLRSVSRVGGLSPVPGFLM